MPGRVGHLRGRVRKVSLVGVVPQERLEILEQRPLVGHVPTLPWLRPISVRDARTPPAGIQFRLTVCVPGAAGGQPTLISDMLTTRHGAEWPMA